MTFTSFASSGSPVRRSDLSEHTLYDLDAVDHFEDCGPEWDDDDDSDLATEEYEREMERLGAAGPPAY